MDAPLSTAVRIAAAESSGGMPAEARLSMPSQDLDYAPPRLPMDPAHAPVWFARIILVSMSLGITVYGVYQMLQVVRFASMTLLARPDDLLLRCVPRVDRFLGRLGDRGRLEAPRSPPPIPRGLGGTLTALVMPIYNEDPTRTTAALQAMARGAAADRREPRLRDRGALRLDQRRCVDSRDGGVDRLRSALAAVMPVWYRRRWRNIARKSGNLEDFVDALGRPLRSHDRARCRQLDRRADACCGLRR